MTPNEKNQIEKDRWRWETLMDGYIDGTLSESDAEKLLAWLEGDAERSEQLVDSLLVHFLLREKYRVLRTKGADVRQRFSQIAVREEVVKAAQDGGSIDSRSTLPSSSSQNDSGSESQEEQELSWDELVELQNAEKPISQMTSVELAAYRAAQKAHAAPVSEAAGTEKTEYDPFAVLRELEEKERIESVRAAQLARQRKKWKFNDFVFAGSLVMAAFLACCIIWQEDIIRVDRPDILKEFEAVGRVTEIVDIEWEEGTPEYKRNQPIGEGSFAFTQGSMQLIMNNGAELILQAPCKFSLVNSMESYCFEGKVSATVPPEAVGYTVNTPYGKVVDQGTEFFLNVDRKNSEVTVVKGKVDLISLKDKVCSLATGMASKINLFQEIKTIPPVPELYYTKESFEKDVSVYNRELARSEAERVEKMRSDTKLLAMYDFSEDKENYENQAQVGARVVTSAQVSDCGRCGGLFWGTKALEFGSPTSGARFTFQNNYSSMTFVATIRVDSTENNINTILASRNWGRQEGAFAWYIAQDGMVYFTISGVPSRGIEYMYRYATPIYFSKAKLGTWTQIAVVLDGPKKKIYHYVDGRLIASRTWEQPMTLVPSEVVLGNYTNDNQDKMFFDGRINNIRIYGTALTREEIFGHKTDNKNVTTDSEIR